MIPRLAAKKILELAQGFPAVAVTGPRQSGKTTLVRSVFPGHTYLSLEDLDVRREAIEDPRGFLDRLDVGVILDEVQHAPDLFPYLQTHLDGRTDLGRVVLTGSQNLTLMERISQSLAGRVGTFELLPFSWAEVRSRIPSDARLEDVLFQGSFPPVHDRPVSPEDWYARYSQTYVDRDVRQIRQVGDLAAFQRFVRLCAGRIGQLVNFSSLAVEAGVDAKTAQAWLSVLEVGYLFTRLRPHHASFHKRLVKQPKLYAVDSGLACAWLGIETARQLDTHPLRGALFENWVVMELVKARTHAGRPPNLRFWRDHVGHEVDLVRDSGAGMEAIEIKSGATLHPSFADGLAWFRRVAGPSLEGAGIIYGGDRMATVSGFPAIPWREVHRSAEVLEADSGDRRT